VRKLRPGPDRASLRLASAVTSASARDRKRRPERSIVTIASRANPAVSPSAPVFAVKSLPSDV